MINTSLFALFGRYKGDASLAGVLENIQRGTYKQFIDEMREALASGDKELAAKLKKKLPAFTPQATYSGKRLDPHITRYNQLVVLDIDHVGERELERITPLATEAPYTVAYFRSPSGDGAKLIAYAATDETAGQSPEGLRGHEPLVRRPARRGAGYLGQRPRAALLRIGRSRPIPLACLPPLAGGYRRATGGPRPATPYLEGGG